MEMAVFVGLPGAGKTTFYRRWLAATHALVSKDRLRNNRSPARRQLVLIEEALRRGQSVAVDNTNPSRADRAPLIALARAHGAETTAYIFEAVVADCLARNAQREGPARVPPVAIYAAARRLQAPSWDEGFDRIFSVRPRGGDFEVEPWPRRKAPPSDR